MKLARNLAAILLLIAPSVYAGTLEELLVEKGVISKGELVQSNAKTPSKVYWSKGTRIEFPDDGFSTQINVFLQTRYTFADNDEDVGRENSSSFDINKARLIVSGTALGGEFEYNLTTDMIGGRNEEGAKSPALLDGFVVWKACDGFSAKMGQWKTGISRQFVAGDQALMFADRSSASNYFSLGRQAGAQALIKTEQTTLAAALFNGLSEGEGINRSGVDTRHTGIVNLRSDLLGKQNVFEEGDVDATQDLALNVGAAYAYSDAAREVDLGDGTFSQQVANLDANLRYQGLSTNAEFYWQRLDLDESSPVQPLGGYLQVGYFLVAKELELAARYSIIDCDGGSALGSCKSNDQVDEVTAGLNYYWWKHHMKLQLNFNHERQDVLEGEEQTTNKWLLQMSAYL